MRIELVVGAFAVVIAGYIIYDLRKSKTDLRYVYLPAPTIGSVRPPTLTQIGPITNKVGSPYLGGGMAPSWSYIE